MRYDQGTVAGGHVTHIYCLLFLRFDDMFCDFLGGMGGMELSIDLHLFGSSSESLYNQDDH